VFGSPPRSVLARAGPLRRLRIESPDAGTGRPAFVEDGSPPTFAAEPASRLAAGCEPQPGTARRLSRTGSSCRSRPRGRWAVLHRRPVRGRVPLKLVPARSAASKRSSPKRRNLVGNDTDADNDAIPGRPTRRERGLLRARQRRRRPRRDRVRAGLLPQERNLRPRPLSGAARAVTDAGVPPCTEHNARCAMSRTILHCSICAPGRPSNVGRGPGYCAQCLPLSSATKATFPTPITRPKVVVEHRASAALARPLEDRTSAASTRPASISPSQHWLVLVRGSEDRPRFCQSFRFDYSDGGGPFGKGRPVPILTTDQSAAMKHRTEADAKLTASVLSSDQLQLTVVRMEPTSQADAQSNSPNYPHRPAGFLDSALVLAGVLAVLLAPLLVIAVLISLGVRPGLGIGLLFFLIVLGQTAILGGRGR
jgi:hypothetical protein